MSKQIIPIELTYTQTENNLVAFSVEQSPNGTSSWSTMINILSTNGTNTQTFTPTQPYVRVKFLSGNAYSLADMILESVDVDTSYSLIARGSYRYSFQGQERDDEIKGAGNSLNYEFRMHDPRLGRFFAIDPLASKYPYYSPYQFSGNRPIDCVELEGLEPESAGKKVGQVEQATGPDGKVYNYTWKNNPNITGKQDWFKGAEYTGPTEDEAAKISQHVYNLLYKGFEPNGSFSKVGNTGYKLIKEYTGETESTGYKAGLYARDIGGVYFYVYATAGTDDLVDAGTDLDLVGGLNTVSFDQSIKDAKRISNWFSGLDNGNHLSFTGHSLGGGLASANALATGRSAKTFNAASITNIKDNYGLEGKVAKIDAYIIEGEAVDYYQRTIVGIRAEGTIHMRQSSVEMLSYEVWEMFQSRSDGFINDVLLSGEYMLYRQSVRVGRHGISNFIE